MSAVTKTLAAAATAAAVAATTAPRLPVLYYDETCPFVHRAWFVALHKQVPVEYRRIALDEEMPASFLALNPAGTVPVLELPGGEVLNESAVIAEYLDAVADPPLSMRPPVPAVRAAMRLFEEAGTELAEAWMGVQYNGQPGDAGAPFRERARRATAAAEALLAAQPHEGPFFLGQEVSLADVMVLPFLHRLDHVLPAYADFDALKDAPRLRRMVEAARLLPAFRASSPSLGQILGRGCGCLDGTAPFAKRPTLYHAAVCPFADRALLAARLSGAAVDVVPVPYGAHTKWAVPAWFEKINPAATLPALVDGPVTLGSSMPIVRYLGERYPPSACSGVPPLEPVEPLEQARAALFAAGVEAVIAAYFAVYADFGANAGPKAALVEALAALDAKTRGPYAIGAALCYADVAVIPFLARMDSVTGPAWAEAAPKLAALLAAARADFSVMGEIAFTPLPPGAMDAASRALEEAQEKKAARDEKKSGCC